MDLARRLSSAVKPLEWSVPSKADLQDALKNTLPASQLSTTISGPTAVERAIGKGDSDENFSLFTQPREPEVAKTPEEILDEYQVAEDTLTEWQPEFGPLPIDIPTWRPPIFGDRLPSTEPRTITQTEADLLDDLGSREGLLGLREFDNIASDARAEADRYFPQVDAAGNPIVGGEDGHNDAFRHALWNARMTKAFGEDFAASFATAHEGVPGNPADREAMDLFNNELGRRIAVENPDASDAELAELVADAVNHGEAVVIDGNNDLVYSDQVAVGRTGMADDPADNGGNAVPEFSEST